VIIQIWSALCNSSYQYRYCTGCLETKVVLNVSSLMISHICIRETVKPLLHHLITAISQSSLLIILNSELQHAIWHVYFKCYIHSICAQYDVSEQSTVLFPSTSRVCDNKRWMYCGWVQWLEHVRLQLRNITDGTRGSRQSVDRW
jgi:hypothetical protein